MLHRSLLLASAFSVAAIVLSGAAHASTFKTLYSFCALQDCADGKAPYSGVILDASGNLYGATQNGGDKGRGVLFKLTPKSDTGNYTYSRLYSFCHDRLCSDGEYPDGDLITDVAGNLYGTALGGDTFDKDQNCGTVFRFTSRGGAHTRFFTRLPVRKATRPQAFPMWARARHMMEPLPCMG